MTAAATRGGSRARARRADPLQPWRSAGRPLLMGVLNVTPDSFSDGGRFADPAAAVEHGVALVAAGADWLDVGGESTRPGSAPVPLDEELRRIVPVVRALARQTQAPISIDTSKAHVAERALDAGATIVNDVTGLRGDAGMARVVASRRAWIILMHMRGTPATMQRLARYRDVVAQVRAFLRLAARKAEAAGIARHRILVDPGLGFGKTARHSLELLRQLPRIVSLGYPVVVGPSRKSFIGTVAGGDVGERLGGTLACVEAARRAGAAVVRVHDVRETVQFLKMLRAIAHEG